MTWKEFKERVEAQGVTDEMELDYVDCENFNNPKVLLFGDDDSFGIE